MTDLAEQGGLTMSQGKKRRIYCLWKKGQVTHNDHRDVVRVFREKIRKSKAQIEINLASAVKHSKKSFYK